MHIVQASDAGLGPRKLREIIHISGLALLVCKEQKKIAS